MKKLTYLFAIGAASLLMTACGGEEKPTEPAEQPETPAAEVCSYTYDASAVAVFWKAYKHTAKVAVNGNFEEITVTGENGTADIPAFINATTFNINAFSSVSGDTLRDRKVKQFFFGNMANAGVISGSFSDVKGSDTKGAGKVTVNLNDTEKTIDCAYEVVDGKVKISTQIDIMNWDATASYEAINEACAEKHTGGDGEVVTWKEMDVLVEVPFTKECK